MPCRHASIRVSSPFSLCFVLLATCASFSTGCSEAPSEPPTIEESSRSTDIYSVRGRIVSLPDPASPASTFSVHHESIPGFRDAQGQVVGMDEMTMPFPPSEQVTLDGLAVGDPILMTFEVDWTPGSRGWSATRVEKLSEDTSLEFDE